MKAFADDKLNLNQKIKFCFGKKLSKYFILREVKGLIVWSSVEVTQILEIGFDMLENSSLKKKKKEMLRECF